MKVAFKVVAVVFILIGISLFGLIRGPQPPRGSFATVASSGEFWHWGFALIALGALCYAVQSFLKEQ
ncbi:MAG: hypothetical protein C0518_07990 [Opitutus sp.]|nr:hypothetical protein [Opitutus sp.]